MNNIFGLSIVVASVVCPSAIAVAEGDVYRELGLGQATIQGEPSRWPETVFHLNGDGSFENGYSFSPFFTQEPDWGSLAEGYPGVEGTVTALGVYLATYGGSTDWGYLDAYVWAYDIATENPGAVLSMYPEVEVTEIGAWPNVTLHDIDIDDALVGSEGFVVGFWPFPWEPQPNAFYTVVDVDGPPGHPRVKIPPGQEYPQGWQHPSEMGLEFGSWGIGAYVFEDPVPAQGTTWGGVKALFR